MVYGRLVSTKEFYDKRKSLKKRKKKEHEEGEKSQEEDSDEENPGCLDKIFKCWKTENEDPDKVYPDTSYGGQMSPYADNELLSELSSYYSR